MDEVMGQMDEVSGQMDETWYIHLFLDGWDQGSPMDEVMGQMDEVSGQMDEVIKINTRTNMERFVRQMVIRGQMDEVIKQVQKPMWYVLSDTVWS